MAEEILCYSAMKLNCIFRIRIVETLPKHLDINLRL